MRRPHTAKQRFRLGPHRYRCRRWNAASNSNRLANSCVERYSVRADNPNTYAKFTACDADTYTKFTACHTYTYASFESDADTYCQFTSRVTNTNSYSDGDSQGNTESSTDSASPANAAMRRTRANS